jgi:hypothetical protein
VCAHIVYAIAKEASLLRKSPPPLFLGEYEQQARFFLDLLMAYVTGTWILLKILIEHPYA